MTFLRTKVSFFMQFGKRLTFSFQLAQTRYRRRLK